jgi:hypothetical protein
MPSKSVLELGPLIGIKYHFLGGPIKMIILQKTSLRLGENYTEPVSLTCPFVLRNLFLQNQIVLEIYFNWPFTNKNCLWWPYKLHDRHEIYKFCTGSPIHHSYKGTIHCAT